MIATPPDLGAEWEVVLTAMRRMTDVCCATLPDADRQALAVEITAACREICQPQQPRVELDTTLMPEALAKSVVLQVGLAQCLHAFSVLGARMPFILLRASGGLKVENVNTIQH